MTFKLYREYYNEELGLTLIFKTDRGFFTGNARLHEGEKRISKFIAGEIAEMKARRNYYNDKRKEYNIQKKTYEYLINAIESKATFYPDDVEYKTILKNYYNLLSLISTNDKEIQRLTRCIKNRASDEEYAINLNEFLKEQKTKRAKSKKEFEKLLKKQNKLKE
jgi:inorganic triphosphatase YgiF